MMSTLPFVDRQYLICATCGKYPLIDLSGVFPLQNPNVASIQVQAVCQTGACPNQGIPVLLQIPVIQLTQA